MAPERRARILLADDHPPALVQAERVLGERFDIAGKVGNGHALLTAAAEHDPDVIVLDITMPGLDGFEAAKRLRAEGSRARLVFLTVWADADFLREAMALGACGYVVKSQLAADLVPAVSAALEGQTFVSPCFGSLKAG